jgi:hypothetical protein
MFRNANYFEFVTDWILDGTIEEVRTLIAMATKDPASVVELWSATFLRLDVRTPGDADSRGQVVELRTRGFLPYTLTWRVEMTEVQHLRRYVQVASGDLAGIATWTIEPVVAGVRVRLEWQVRANKPIIRWLAFLLRPLFARNHRWAMARGAEAASRALRAIRARSFAGAHAA